MPVLSVQQEDHLACENSDLVDNKMFSLEDHVWPGGPCLTWRTLSDLGTLSGLGTLSDLGTLSGLGDPV